MQRYGNICSLDEETIFQTFLENKVLKYKCQNITGKFYRNLGLLEISFQTFLYSLVTSFICAVLSQPVANLYLCIHHSWPHKMWTKLGIKFFRISLTIFVKRICDKRTNCVFSSEGPHRDNCVAQIR